MFLWESRKVRKSEKSVKSERRKGTEKRFMFFCPRSVLFGDYVHLLNDVKQLVSDLMLVIFG